ncbi:MAG: carbohydrate binding family 9 domain-containing protein [Chitinophagaceae bacterium]|nr:carbohydrate binding family 9 domain-containing protein [Chitinophagaceae bacterium]
MKQLLLAILFLYLLLPATAQNIFPPDVIKKKLEAVRIENSIKIDGKLDEPEWQLAKPIPDFIQIDPKQGELAKKRTVVRVLYNKNFLYVSAICYDTVGHNKYRVLNFKRDYSSGNTDFFAFAVDGYNDERNSVMFSTNPYGAQRDLLSFDDNYYDVDWDGLWYVRTQRTDTAWTAEIAVPWKTLRYKKSLDSLQTWGISFGRLARASNEFSSWPAFPRAYGPLRMPYAAKLINVKAPKPSTNIRLNPYTLYSYNETKENSKTVFSKSNVKPGGDIKWALNPNTLLDLTFNTDFAQADVDRKVNNINRFSVFFPERRQFFLENAGLFTVGMDPLPNGQADYSARIQPFFSRAIGLDAIGNPLNIDAGARLVYRSNKRNAGGLFIRQDGNDSVGAANFMVARYSQNFGKQNRVGTLISYKTEEPKNNGAAAKNFTGTIDGFFRFSQGLSLSMMGSLTADFKNNTGYAASAQLYYNSNTWIAWWNQSVVSAEYNPKMGFVARGNVIITDPGFFYQIRSKWLPKFIRSTGPGVSYTMYHNATTGKLTDLYINSNPIWFQFQNGGVVSWYAILTKQILENDFSPLGVTIAKGTYEYTRHTLSVSSDQSKKISASLAANLGKFYNGTYNSFKATVSFAPMPYFFLSPIIEVGKLKNVGFYRTTKNVTLYQMEGRVALNPRMQLSGLFQKSSASNTVSWNTRFSWEFRPLSYFYIVYNNNSIPQTIKTTDQQMIAKISYLKQF